MKEYTYNWMIDSIEVSNNSINGYDDVVVSCKWKVESALLWEREVFNNPTITKSVETAYANKVGIQTFVSPTDNFMPLEVVEKQTILNWLWSYLDKNSIESDLKTELDEKQSPPTRIIKL